jgi:hypothetical protein
MLNHQLVWLYRFNGIRDSIRDNDKLTDFKHDKHKLMHARSEKHYKHTAFLVFNRNGGCFLEIDNYIEIKDSFGLLPLSQSLSTRG